MMRIDRYLRLCFGEALRGLAGRRRGAASAVLIIALSLVVLGGFLLVSDNLNDLLYRWRERGHVQVFLEPDLTASQQQAVADAIQVSPEVDSFRFMSATEAATQFREDFQELGDLLEFLEDNPLPASFIITVRESWRTEEALVDVAQRWGAMSGVDAAQYDLQVIRRLELGVNGLWFVGAVLGGAVLIAAIITSANVIRVLVVARKREIVVLRLVGATESVVRGRFLAEGAIKGLLGSLLALAALYGICKIGVAFVTAGGDPLLSLVELHFFDGFLFVELISLGVAAGLIGALLAFGAASSLEQ
jgi:cell division transport system permease protein